MRTPYPHSPPPLTTTMPPRPPTLMPYIPYSLTTSGTPPLMEAKTNMEMTTVSNSAISCVVSTGGRQVGILLTVKKGRVQEATTALVRLKGQAGAENTRRPTH